MSISGAGERTTDPTFPDRLLFFDGVCNLCNGLVRFILQHERRPILHFAALQSEAGQRFLHEHPEAGQVDSLIYWRKGRVLLRSTAALHVARDMGGPWQMAFTLMIIPRIIRDPIYDLIAHKRYRWFGKRDDCMVPQPEQLGRFL